MRTNIAPPHSAKLQHMIDREPVGDVERLQHQAFALETTAARDAAPR